MIVWLASYPRSGNTWIRALISNYLYSKKEDTLKNLESIDLFPSAKYFSGLIDKKKIDENKKNIFKNYILAQEKLNLNKKINIIKTHCFAGNVEGKRNLFVSYVANQAWSPYVSCPTSKMLELSIV